MKVMPGWSILALCVLTVALTACKGGSADDGECVDDRTYFQKEVWSVVKANDCRGCHSLGGDAQSSNFILESEEVTGFLDHNMAAMRDIAAFERDGESVLLLKPTNTVPHSGGQLFTRDSEDYKVLAEMVERFRAPTTCGDASTSQEHFEGLVLMTPEETLRKAAVNLTGRLPTAAEEFRVATGGMEALDIELDRMMLEDAFFQRIEQIWNDQFLVERYLGGDNAVDLLDTDFYPNIRWYMPGDEDNPRDFSNENQEFLAGARMYTNDAVARAPLKLASYLVKNDLPFTEIVTADYMIVNPYSARAYGITDVAFDDKLDPEEWKPGRIPNHPHAGVITDPMWLNRFPTTPTNRNRARARMVFWFFLSTDLLKLADRPLDIATASATTHNPERFNPDCAVCHATMDPVAGMLQNWDEFGSYNPRDQWYLEMDQPGFGDWTLPPESTPIAAQLLGKQIALDRRFALAMLHHMYRGITGDEPIGYPANRTAADFDARLVQYEVQDRYFDRIANAFIDTNYNLKTIVKEIVKSPYFRAKGHTTDSETVLANVAELGQGRMLTPELLDKKIVAVTGRRWANNDGPYLLRESQYLILYGGIDSNDVTVRISDPNGIMSSIQYRMANEMACSTVARDFTLAPEKRRYFPHVEPNVVPLSNNFAVPEAEAKIRKVIKYLHWHILGESLQPGDPQLDATFKLFVDTWKELNDAGNDNLANACRATTDALGNELPEEQRITDDPNYTIRAWMAVVTYMLSDYKFLYE